LYGTGSWRLIAGDGELLTPTSNVTDVLDLSRRTPNKFLWEVSYAECTNAVEVQVVSNSLQSLADAGEDGVTTNGMFRLSAKSFDSSSITGEWTVVGGSGEFADPTSPNTYVTGLSQGINTFRWTLKGYDCEAYDDVQVRSADEPVAGFNMVNDKGCEPLTVLFNNITLGDATYHWDFGDGTASTLRSPEHIFEKAGVYKVTLTATGKYRTDKTEQYVTVLSSPTAAFTVSSTQLYVPNAEAHFYNSSDRVEEYYWDFGDGHSSTEKDPVHMYYEDGEYDITYIVTDLNGCKDTLTYENYIHVGKGSFIVFPTAFTPNLEQQLDGRYEAEERRLDIFYPVSRNVDTYRLEVYNQWGNMVFVTEDLYEGWNGYYLDQPAAQGTYVYKAEGRFRDGTAFRQGGSILLIR
jgi:PKD repeat protein